MRPDQSLNQSPNLDLIVGGYGRPDVGRRPAGPEIGVHVDGYVAWLLGWNRRDDGGETVSRPS
jgi:hypothetical protein